MTKTAILTATELEMAPLRAALGDSYIYCVTGVGIYYSTTATLRLIELEHPDFIIQVGIAGAIDKNLQLGQVVVVERDYIADMGAMRGEVFERFATEIFENPRRIKNMQSVGGRTVSTACAPWIMDESQVESMEGAAFMAVCAAAGIEHLQIRAISNYIDTPRSQWRIAAAVAALPAAILNVERVTTRGVPFSLH